MFLISLFLTTILACGEKKTSGGVDFDGDGFSAEQDCDDFDANIYPGSAANEPNACGADADGDGYVRSEDGGSDCDDNNNSVYPGAEDVCDTIDNDCDESIDEDGEGQWYADNDYDGYGDPDNSIEGCRPEGGLEDGVWVADSSDCDDDNYEICPSCYEYCDGLDNDCDGQVDGPGSENWILYYEDLDCDSHYNPNIEAYGMCDTPPDGCYIEAEWVETELAALQDCDDTDDNITSFYGEAPGVCGQDYDGDGFVSVDEGGTDCNDDDGLISPYEAESCGDGVDNDCDGQIDEADCN